MPESRTICSVTDGLLIAEVTGRLDAARSRDFETTVSQAIRQRADDIGGVVVDLEGVRAISSAGLRALLKLAKAQQARRGWYAICAVQGPVRSVLSVSGFDRILRIFASRSLAVTRFRYRCGANVSAG